MKKTLYFIAICSVLPTLGMQNQPNMQTDRSSRRLSTCIDEVAIDMRQQRADIVIDDDGDVDYTSSLSSGFIITPEIIADVGGDSMLNILSTTHQKLYHGAPLDGRALILSRAIMDKYAKSSIISKVIRDLLPSFWSGVNKVSNIGQYAIAASSPLMTSINLLLGYILEDSDNSTSYSTGVPITQTLNAASLLAFHIGTYVASNIYSYSSGLKDYYINESYEKDYIKATMKLNHESEYYNHIPDRQKAGKLAGLTIPQDYYDKFGPLATETARQIMISSDDKELLTIKKSAEKATTLLSAYRKSSVSSIAEGLCRITAGACAMCNTIISTTSLLVEDESLTQTLSATQIVLATLSMTLGGLANFFGRRSGFYSRSFLLYPIYKPELVGQMEESTMEEDDPQN